MQSVCDIDSIVFDLEFKGSRFDEEFIVGDLYVFYHPTLMYYAAFKVQSFSHKGSDGKDDIITGTWYLETNPDPYGIQGKPFSCHESGL